jgi:uncharacterized membrane protein
VIRVLKHLLMPDWLAMRGFSSMDLKTIEEAIRDSERQHDGELRFVVEAGLPVHFLTKKTRIRAEALFAELGVWNTENNSGVLVYVEVVDRRIEIVADRGIAVSVAQAEWDAICREMQDAFARRAFLDGSLAGIRKITALLARHFPPRGQNPNELTDKPVVL